MMLTTNTVNFASLQHPLEKQSRIPVTLQSVFLASNRGADIHEPPPNREASKLFRNKSKKSSRCSDMTSPNRTRGRTLMESFSFLTSARRGKHVRGTMDKSIAKTTSPSSPASGSLLRRRKRSPSSSHKLIVPFSVEDDDVESIIDMTINKDPTPMVASFPHDSSNSPLTSKSEASHCSPSRQHRSLFSSPMSAIKAYASHRLTVHENKENPGHAFVDSPKLNKPDIAVAPPNKTVTFDTSVAARQITESSPKSRKVSLAGSDMSISPIRSPRKKITLSPGSPGKTKKLTSLSPKDYFDAMVRSRGYSIATFKVLETAYYNKPTALQQASFHSHLFNLVRTGDTSKFASIVSSGVSLNPCSSHGESLVHMICRRGDADFLKILLRENDGAGSILQVSDDYGRTPLHDACWTANPCFEIIEMILNVDRHLLHMMDCRGATPLAYVRKNDWAAWLEFLQSKKDMYWPRGGVQDGGRHGNEDLFPRLAAMKPNTCPLADPPNALSPYLAELVVSGRVLPTDVEYFLEDEGTLMSEGSGNEDDSDGTDWMSEEDSDDYDTDDDLEVELRSLAEHYKQRSGSKPLSAYGRIGNTPQDN